MVTFYICRHGETENNREGRLSGWIDSPLTANGLVPTETVLQKLQGVQVDKIYSSDTGRAFITAYAIARRRNHTDEIVRLPGLREVNYGDAANMIASEAYQLYPDLDRGTHYTPPGGESLDSMQSRVLAAVARLDNLHGDETVLLAAHSGVMAALRASHTGQDFGQHNITGHYPHDYVAKFTVVDGKIASFEEVTAS